MNRRTFLGGFLVMLLVSPVIVERNVLLSQAAPVTQVESVAESVSIPSNSDDRLVAAPYPSYTQTQGPHGQSYGHYAYDLKAGNEQPIYSSINGVVTQKFVDGIGNPTLVIENSIYESMLLHGVYSVSVGDRVKIGQQIGTESNIGNTRDAWGNSCRGRDCGYHSHWNLKKHGVNVDPMKAINVGYTK